jgi:hypothetical protein
MGLSNANPCPVCGSVYSDYSGNSIFNCRGCNNIFNNATQKWNRLESKVEAKVTALREAIKGALRIKDLWLPGEVDMEHKDEAEALYLMNDQFLKVLSETES